MSSSGGGIFRLSSRKNHDRAIRVFVAKFSARCYSCRVVVLPVSEKRRLSFPSVPCSTQTWNRFLHLLFCWAWFWLQSLLAAPIVPSQPRRSPAAWDFYKPITLLVILWVLLIPSWQPPSLPSTAPPVMAMSPIAMLIAVSLIPWTLLLYDQTISSSLLNSPKWLMGMKASIYSDVFLLIIFALSPPANYIYWDDDSWKEAGNSSTTLGPTMSSFALFEEVISSTSGSSPI